MNIPQQDIVILTPMDTEYNAVQGGILKTGFEAREEVKSDFLPDMKCKQFTNGEQNIYLGEVGVGAKAKPILNTAEIVRLTNRNNFFFILGVAGGINLDLQQGDIVKAGRLRSFKKFIAADEEIPEQNIQRATGFSFEALHEMKSKILNLSDTSKKEILTSNFYIHNPRLVDAIRKYYPNVSACDMESHDIVETLQRLQVPPSQISVHRSISDMAGAQGSTDFTNNINDALESLTNHTQKIITELCQ